MVSVARRFLRNLELSRFSSLSEGRFSKVLEEHTLRLAEQFPVGGHGNWGAARKALNIFLRDVIYCRPLCDHYKLAYLEHQLELPLDSNCYEGLLVDADDGAVPSWPGVKALNSAISDELQNVASTIAQRWGVPRVHLDVKYWRKAAVDDLSA